MHANAAKRLPGSAKNATVIDVPGCDEDCSNEPSTEGTRRHGGVIVVINDGTDLSVWGVLTKQR